VLWCGAAHLKRVQHVLKMALCSLLRCVELKGRWDAVTAVLKDLGYREEALQIRKQMEKLGRS
jgi:hypothetical protein